MEGTVEENYLQIIAGFKSAPKFWIGDLGKEQAQSYVRHISKLGNVNLRDSDLDAINEITKKNPGSSLEAGIISSSLESTTHAVFGAVYQVNLVVVGTNDYLNTCRVTTFNNDIVAYHRISRVNRATLDVTVGFDNKDDTTKGLVSNYIATFFNKENNCNNSIKDPYYECGEVDRGKIDATADGPIRAVLKLRERLTSYVKPRRDSHFVNNSLVYYWRNGEGSEKAQEKGRKSEEEDEESPRLHERYEAE